MPSKLAAVPAERRYTHQGGDLSAVRKLMMRFGPLMQQRKLKEAEALLDEALKLFEPESESVPGKNRQ